MYGSGCSEANIFVGIEHRISDEQLQEALTNAKNRHQGGCGSCWGDEGRGGVFVTVAHHLFVFFFLREP